MLLFTPYIKDKIHGSAFRTKIMKTFRHEKLKIIFCKV